MTTAQAIILGIIEGLSEFLPISSTGHLTIASHVMGIVQNEQFIAFEIAIQLGAILAVFLLYWRSFLDLDLLKKLFVAFLPTALIGFTIYKFIKTLLVNEFIVVCSLVVGGIVLILTELKYKKELAAGADFEQKVGYRNAVILGLAQSVAMIPGVSRSGAIIVTGLLLKLERKALVEFTFLLAVPTMSAATLYSLYKNKDILSVDYIGNIAIGFVTSFIVALIVIKLFLNYIKKYDFIPFGVYRIVFGLIIFAMLINWY